MKNGVVAFAFGMPASIPANLLIAERAYQIARQQRAAVFTQADIQFDSTQTNIAVNYINEASGKPPPTLRIARAAMHWACSNEIETLWVIAAEPHQHRAYKDMLIAKAEMGATTTVFLAPITGLHTWFSPESTQWHTSSEYVWYLREGVLTHLPQWLYKRVAS